MPGTSDENMRLLLDIVGEDGIDRLSQSTANYRQLLIELAAQFRRGEITAEEFQRSERSLSGELERQTQLLNALDAAQQRAAHATDAFDDANDALNASLAQLRTEQDAAAQAADRQAAADRAAAQAAAQLDAENDALNASLAQLRAEEDAAAAAIGRSNNALWAADQTMDTYTTDTNRASSAHGRLGSSAGNAAGGTRNLNQSIIAGSYAFQDFTATSGDLGAKLNSVSNNLPTLLMGLGGLGTVISISATAAIALYRSWDSVAALWETRNPFPKSGADIAAWKRELERAKDELEKLEKAGKGNDEQLRRHGELLKQTAELEAKVTAEQEKQARLKGLLESKTDEDEGRAAAFKGATKGKGAEFESGLEKALRAESRRQLEAARQTMAANLAMYAAQGHTQEDMEKYMTAESVRFKQLEAQFKKADFRDDAKRMEDKLLQGDATAGKTLARLAEQTPGAGLGGVVAKMDELNPQEKKRRDERMEALNQQGEDNEKVAMERMKKAREEELDALKGQLAAIKQLGGLERAAKELQGQASAKGLQGDSALKYVQDALKEGLKGALAARGFKAQRGLGTDLDTPVDQLAGQAAGKGATDAEKDAEAKVDRAVQAFAPKLKESLSTQGAAGIAAGTPADQLRAELKSKAERTLEAGGIGGATGTQAAARIAADVMNQLEAQVATKQAELPADEPAKPGAKGKPRARPKPGKRPPPKPVMTARQRAAAALAGDARAKAKRQQEGRDKQADRSDDAARQESLARQIYGASRGMTGQQLTSDQSREAAKAAMKSMQQLGQLGQTQEGVNAAVMQAMSEIVSNQQAIFARLNQQKTHGNNVARSARKVRVAGETRLDN